MPAQMFFYDNYYDLQWGAMNLKTADIRVMLVTSDYTFDASHETIAAVLGSPSCEVAAIASPSNGYTTGGELLANGAVTVVASPKTTQYDADDVVWTALDATFRYAIYYIDGEVEGITDPPLCCVLLDNTPADIVVSGVDYKLQHSANGLFTSALL